MIRVFTSKTQTIGERGENEAVRFLKKQGFSIIERNVTNKFGEIDIVAKKKGKVHLFEVKTARSRAGIFAAENLTKAKLHKFFVSAEYYALTHSLKEYQMEGILVTLSDNPHNVSKVEMIELF
ncbi:MAG TPA: YraN family protein [Candidatus Paceibacterota bacterium]|nr:YraN family protein [Candidatus Paceibacterota bacterium]